MLYGTADGGMLVWFADPDETLFSIGRRFGVPTARVRACNPNLSEPIREGMPVLPIRQTVRKTSRFIGFKRR